MRLNNISPWLAYQTTEDIILPLFPKRVKTDLMCV
jgi:hypothetical protein